MIQSGEPQDKAEKPQTIAETPQEEAETPQTMALVGGGKPPSWTASVQRSWPTTSQGMC